MPAVPVLFTHYGGDWIRGSEQVLLDLLAHLDRTRIEPVLWCNGEEMAASGRALGIPTYVTKFEYFFFPEDSPPFDWRRYRTQTSEGLALARKHRVRFIHANSAAPVQWMLPAARTARLPLLVHLHIPYRRRGRYLFGLHQATCAVGVCTEAVSRLWADGMPKQRTRVIYNGIDPARLQPAENLALPREPGDIVITSAGSLIRRKGHDLVIEAFRRIQPTYPNTRLWIVSDGPDRAWFEQLAAQSGCGARIHFLGHRSPAELGAIYRASDIMALASRGEAFPLVIPEAGYFCVPFVATSVGGIPEAIADAETGLLVPPDDVDALTRALLRLIKNPEERHNMGCAARKRVVERFTVHHMAAAFHDLYDELLRIPPAQLGWSGGWNSFKPYARLAFQLARGEREQLS